MYRLVNVIIPTNLYHVPHLCVSNTLIYYPCMFAIGNWFLSTSSWDKKLSSSKMCNICFWAEHPVKYEFVLSSLITLQTMSRSTAIFEKGTINKSQFHLGNTLSPYPSGSDSKVFATGCIITRGKNDWCYFFRTLFCFWSCKYNFPQYLLAGILDVINISWDWML